MLEGPVTRPRASQGVPKRTRVLNEDPLGLGPQPRPQSEAGSEKESERKRDATAVPKMRALE